MVLVLIASHTLRARASDLGKRSSPRSRRVSNLHALAGSSSAKVNAHDRPMEDRKALTLSRRTDARSLKPLQLGTSTAPPERGASLFPPFTSSLVTVHSLHHIRYLTHSSLVTSPSPRKHAGQIRLVCACRLLRGRTNHRRYRHPLACRLPHFRRAGRNDDHL